MYNHANTIGACLMSVFAQSLPPHEVIVVNDASSDRPEEALRPFLNQIRLIDQQENQGACKTRNNGFEHASGELVIFCDADVVMAPSMLESLAHQLTQFPDAGYAYSGFRFGWKPFSSFPFSASKLKEFNYIHTTALIRREVFPGFDPELKRFQDWDLWLTMLDQGTYGVFVDEELFHVLTPKGRVGISKWRPSITYKIPWERLGWIPGSVRNYNQAKRRIIEKHELV